MPFFTIGDSGQYPEDLKLARQRFRRRRPEVEKYYKESDPESYHNPFLAVMKVFGVLLIYPFWVIAGSLKDEDHPSKEVQGIEEYEKKKSQIKAYIKEDLKKEEPSE